MKPISRRQFNAAAMAAALPLTEDSVPVMTERNYDADRKAESRAKARELDIPSVANQERRAACEADDELWLKTYCPDVFYNPFTPHQKQIIADCGEALKYGTSKCKAAPRGDGKSSLVKYLSLKYALTRQVFFPLIIAATAEKGKKTLASLKRRLAGAMSFNQQAMACKPISVLGEDYPLECGAAAYVDPWPSRARNAVAKGGKKIHVEWGASWIVLPTWEETEPLGPILFALGITSDELQGCNIYDRRPDFVMLDDLDSRDSLASEDGAIAGKIEEAIDKTVAGLGGQNRGLGQFMLCTITSRESAAYKYSDPSQKPAYSGERIPAIIKWPDECNGVGKDLVLGPLAQTYIEMRQWGQTPDSSGKPPDVFGRKAHQHFVDNREAIEAGAILSNPHNYMRNLLPDGTPTHVSAYQRCLDYIADRNFTSFLTEHQNDPPETSGALESNINPLLIQKQVNGLQRGIIPPGCVLVTHSCDVGKIKGFHWVVRAWKPDGTSHVIDYGITDVIGARHGTDEGLERAIFNTVLRRMDEFKSRQYTTADGEILESISTFDARWQMDAVFSAVAKCGLGVHALIGIGKSAGCISGSFRDVITDTDTRKKCGTPGAYREKHTNGRWAIHASADKWKGFEHERWLTPTDRPGCAFLFGEPSTDPSTLSPDERDHERYAKHICSEREIEEDMKRKWKHNGSENDFFDASWHTCVAAAIKGIRVLSVEPTSQRKQVTIPKHLKRA